MKKLRHLLLAPFLLASPPLHAEDQKPAKPNVILIISDDQGFNDYGFMGHESIQTPHIDKMAADSMLYTRGYVMPVCSPTLASLLTGKLPSGHGITGNDLTGKRPKQGQRDELLGKLLDNSLMLPKAISDAGYLTFQTGKLWNATYKDVGFTHGMTDTAGRHGDAGLKIGRAGMKPIYDFIKTAQTERKPFFIWHAPFLPHTPHNPPEKILVKYKGKGPTPEAEKYFAMVEWFDNTCGELDKHLEKNGLKDNTVILYLADNGWDANLGYESKRSKLSPYENGIRTPMFVRWPAKLKPLRDEQTLTHVIDIPTTILEITGAKKPDDLKGLNLMDPQSLKTRDAVFVEAYTHDIADLKDPTKSLIAEVIVDGWWKLIVPGPAKPDRPFSGVPAAPELYNLETDPMEKADLAAKHPEVVAKLRAKLVKR
jgi:arylsulfatase A-like enzyme